MQKVPVYLGMKIENEYGKRIFKETPEKGRFLPYAFFSDPFNGSWTNLCSKIGQDLVQATLDSNRKLSKIKVFQNHEWVSLEDLANGKIEYIMNNQEVKSGEEYLKLFPIDIGTIVKGESYNWMIIKKDNQYGYCNVYGTLFFFDNNVIINPQKFWEYFISNDKTITINNITYQKPNWNTQEINGVVFIKDSKNLVKVKYKDFEFILTKDFFAQLLQITDSTKQSIVIGCKTFSVNNLLEVVNWLN